MSKRSVAENSVRMLNLGPTNWLRTQSVVRATIAHTFELGRDSVMISTPLHHYVAVGEGSDPHSAVNLTACAEHDVPVIVTPFDAPATFYNTSALIFQFVIRTGIWDSNATMLRDGLVQGLEAAGLAQVEIVNDEIHTSGRPVGTVQTATYDDLIVVQHAFYFQYDPAFARLLGVETSFTGLWTQLKSPASPEMILHEMLAAYATSLNRPIDRGTPKQVETRISKEIDLQLIDEAQSLLESERHTHANH